ncbi:MAG: ribonuclease PH [Planctomycetota bacterium]
MRSDGRAFDALRPVTIQRHFTENPGGSVLINVGRTMVLCTAMLEEGVPSFLLNSGRGWLTAEYSMLPGSTQQRKTRDLHRVQADGRSVEIQRLIGRSLRAVTDLTAWVSHTLWVDCDVLQAHGGTRTAAITGAYVAMWDAFKQAEHRGLLKKWPLLSSVAAVSVGIVQGELVLDLDAVEDAQADVDMNIVLTGNGDFVEVQGTAEKGAFDAAALQKMLALARTGIEQLTTRQREALCDNPAMSP